MDDKLKSEYTEDFYANIRELSNYVSELKMSEKINDELVNLILKQLELIEKEAFLRGFKFGMKYKFDNLLEQEEHLINANQDGIYSRN